MAETPSNDEPTPAPPTPPAIESFILDESMASTQALTLAGVIHEPYVSFLVHAPGNQEVLRVDTHGVVYLGKRVADAGEAVSDSVVISTNLSTGCSQNTSQSVLISSLTALEASDNTSQSLLISTAQSTADGGAPDSVARSGVLSNSVNISTNLSTEGSDNASQSLLISTGGSQNTSQSVLISAGGSQNTSQSVLISGLRSQEESDNGSQNLYIESVQATAMPP